jgi:lipid-binding SYLF domain-containing protein
MKKMCLTLALMLSFGAIAQAQDGDEVKRIGEAKTVFQEIMATPEKGIPHDLLEKAHCVVIVPSAKRAGFIVGGQYGVGVATCRASAATGGWSGVSTVKIEGGSFGLQIGGGETDIVMLVMNESGAKKLMKSEFTLGGEGAVMAGPIGRTVTAETDAYFRAEILSWSRSRGVFAGVALKGSTLRSDDEDNKDLYGKAVKHEDILLGKVPATAAAKPLLDAISQHSKVEKK